jgi:elongation factor Ts
MTEISATLVRELREATNVSMMECKKALTETNGDMAKATKLLRERGMAVAAKRAAKSTNAGVVAAAASPDGKTSALVEVNCETDFVARNEGFQVFVRNMAQKALSTDAQLSEQASDELAAQVAAIGEKIVIRRNVRFTLKGTGAIATYIHMGGKVGVLVEVGCGKAETTQADAFKVLISDLTLHVAACCPLYLTSAEVPADVLAAEREIYAKQVQDKPAQIVDKIVDGKIKKFYADTCFVDQLFVKEQKETITQLLASKGKELGDTLSIRRFVRYQMGA